MGRLSVIRLQENPDGPEGHEERERFQEESKQFPVKRKYVGKDRHWFTKPPVAKLSAHQKSVAKRLDMKENCEDYTETCSPNKCFLCVKRDERTKQIVEKANRLIEEYENKRGL